ncbi:Uncharacterised protein [Suttonella ornithocola]|uniref:Uncharacterized protein n=1 Tax=Suttonella ornithocola TaxID=279832 RepID=A0A380MRP5_9GAMM|nr:Uncharacterised protein [Suttonella ornithocola]
MKNEQIDNKRFTLVIGAIYLAIMLFGGAAFITALAKFL